MGFTKLDDGLIYSSLLTEDDSVFKVWMVLLSLCRPPGIAPISSAYLASVTRKTQEEIDRCLLVLSSPDPASRTKEHEGRRIEITNDGIFLYNYEKYRARQYSKNPNAERVRLWRERQRTKTPMPELQV
jgi:hypothetical protein